MRNPVINTRKCLVCPVVFLYSETNLVRSYMSKQGLIGSVDRKFCSNKCKMYYRNILYNPSKTEQGRKRISEYAKKRGTAFLHTPESIEKQRKTITGSGHWNWQGGITPLNRRRRNQKESRDWRKAIFSRDDYTCQVCGSRNGNGKSVYLQADHIKPWSLFPELRYDMSNGRTLCIDCHKQTSTYMGRIKNYSRLSSV